MKRQIDAMEKQRLESDARKIRATRPTDKNIPEGVKKIIVGDGVEQYKKLRSVERKIDGVMMRKRLDMEDAKSGQSITSAGWGSYPGLSRGKNIALRVWISNTVENQPWQSSDMEEGAFDFSMESEARYKVRIQGKILDEEEDDEDGKSDDGFEDERKGSDDIMDAATEGQTNGELAPEKKPQLKLEEPKKKTKFSQLFKSITIDFDREPNQQPEQMSQIVWENKGAQSSIKDNFDTLEFERKSDENINCRISFYRDEHQWAEKHLLSKPLSELLDTTEDDRTSIMMGIWEYVRINGLQQDEEKRQIHCDERMRAVSSLGQPSVESTNWVCRFSVEPSYTFPIFPLFWKPTSHPCRH